MPTRGFRVVGVDIRPQPSYPYEFHREDALEFLRLGLGAMVDAVHASPPCQAFTAYGRNAAHVRDDHPNLIPATRDALRDLGVPYVIENVVGAPLEEPLMLCGSSFGLDVRRHRLFECSFSVLVPPCDHSWQTPRFPPASNRTNLRSTVEVGAWRIPLDVQQRAMGIDWMDVPELSQAIPPAYTRCLGEQLIQHVGR